MIGQRRLLDTVHRFALFPIYFRDKIQTIIFLYLEEKEEKRRGKCKLT